MFTMFLLYNILFFFGFLVLSPYYLWRMRRRGGYAKDFGQRFGLYRPEVREQLAKGGAIWIHSVSVGETNAVALVVCKLRALYPANPIVWSTTTSTGYAEIRKRKPSGVVPLYYPLDFPWIVNRVLRLIQPRALVLAESEIWPNMIRTLARAGIPVALINAKISPRSHRRYLKLGPITQQTFGHLSLVAAQEQEDIERLAALGVPRDRIHVVGSLKFDTAIPIGAGSTGVPACDPGTAGDPWASLLKLGVAPCDPILVGGSTWPGEEETLFDLVRELRTEFPKLFLVVVPRHAERTNEIVQIAKHKRVKMALRTELDADRDAECLLVNTTGELRAFYEVATLVFVGKSLFVVEKSLQNPIEAAALGKPVIVGPHIESFEAIVKRFVSAGAMIQVRDVEGLQTEVIKLLRDESLRKMVGGKARQIVDENRGAVERTVRLMELLVGPRADRGH